jgi:hypothetical protein
MQGIASPFLTGPAPVPATNGAALLAVLRVAGRRCLTDLLACHARANRWHGHAARMRGILRLQATGSCVLPGFNPRNLAFLRESANIVGRQDCAPHAVKVLPIPANE